MLICIIERYGLYSTKTKIMEFGINDKFDIQ